MGNPAGVAFNYLGRLVLIVFSLFLSVASLYFKWKIATVVAIGLLAANFLDSITHRKVFRINRYLVTLVGSVIWLVIACVEVT